MCNVHNIITAPLFQHSGMMATRRRKLVLWLLCTFPVYSSFGQEVPVLVKDREKRYCMSTVNFGATTDKEPKFHCTHEEIPFTYDETGRPFRKNNKRISAAIAQRIDGSEAEQNAIREVIRKQDEYMLREVYALPEYESVRYRCGF
ncbi:hypothetical protein MPSEU_000488900 [Mayamaea pseudoterrestris]|nr:hypothetical protein MPSEU_000488900 [Mayamaea pseudoterrestris]